MVIGSDTSATGLAGDLALVLECRHGVMKKGPEKEQIWQGEMVKGEVVSHLIGDDERVLRIEELMTTAFTAERLRQGIIAAHQDQIIDILPVILVLMHRSTVYEVAGAKVLAIHHFDISNWPPEECPYSKGGSPLVENPKQNWHLLMA